MISNIPLLFGNYNKNIKRMREAFHVRIRHEII